jgi:hypothetical protein
MRVLLRFFPAARLCLAIAVSVAMTGCASFYVDNGVKEVGNSQFVKVQPQHAVQLLFVAQTKGIDNVQVTAKLRPMVVERIKATGLFTDISDTPVPGGALLNVTWNNVSLSDHPEARGFVTGATFGLVGTTVGDGFIVKASYSAQPGAPTISKEARHAVYTSIGATSGPDAPATKVDNVQTAMATGFK